MEEFTIRFSVPVPLAKAVVEIAEDNGVEPERLLAHMASTGVRESIENILAVGQQPIQEAQQTSGLGKDMEEIQSQFAELQKMMSMIPQLKETVNALEGLRTQVPAGPGEKDSK
jgi:hypothetical protein